MDQIRTVKREGGKRMKQKKRIVLLLVCGLLLLGLAACQGKGKSAAESNWRSAKKEKSLVEYVKKNQSELDMEALKGEAGDSESPLSRQFQATALLCALEYQNSLSGAEEGQEDSMYQMEYPVSAGYAESLLGKAATEKEAFWKAMEEAFYPYDCFELVFAAAGHLDGASLAELTGGIPEDSGYQSDFLEAAEQWIENHPVSVTEYGDAMLSTDFFGDWTSDDWKDVYFRNYNQPDHVKADTVGEALSYVNYLRSKMLPKLEAEFGGDGWKSPSEFQEGNYYATGLTVSIGEQPAFQEAEEGSMPEVIETEGKKVVAFYRNLQEAEYKGSPAPFRLLGDFMLQLPAEECPVSLEDTDYYFVLTPSYEPGEYYQDQSGNETKIQEVYSNTSIDLYDAKTGVQLRHLGVITEEPADRIFEDLTLEAFEFPKVTTADILTYIYHNVNNPDAFISLLDNTAGLGSELQPGESVILGSWEITYQSKKIVESFDDGMFQFTASDGRRFLMADFTITNRGTEKETFLPMIYQIGKDPVVQVADAAKENYYDCVDALGYGKCLNGTSLEPGESEEGQLIFEVPTELAEGEGAIYIVVSLGNKNVSYLLNGQNGE